MPSYDAQRGSFAAAQALALGIILACGRARFGHRPALVTGRGAWRRARTALPGPTPRPNRQLVCAFRAMHEELSGRMDELRRGREETAVLLGSMVEGVIAVDPAGDVVFCNTALRRLLGFTDADVLPNLRELFRQTEARRIVDAVLGGEAVLGRELTLDGRVVLVTARPLPTRGAVICLHDITDFRRLEVVRRDFVANVSHELRTPLTSIAGWREILARDALEPQTAAQFLEDRPTPRACSTVDDLLDLARLESGTCA
jgi:signal transduction histidine kinase